MGCDIHGFIDYDINYEEIYTRNFAKLSITRDYCLFTLLAGVRGDEIQGQKPISLPKGLPDKISCITQLEAYYLVLDLEETTEHRCCTRSQAEKWGSKYADETKRWTHDPDTHSHSWLNVNEVEEVVRRYSMLKYEEKRILDKGNPIPEDCELVAENHGALLLVKKTPATVPIELLVILDVMKSLEKENYASRFVFWFDN